ncbi:MAG: hypothetical protein ACFFC7_16290 [Candidatus Hermodarchaeota archaeon]
MSHSPEDQSDLQRLKHLLAVLDQELKEQKAENDALERQIAVLHAQQETNEKYLAEWEQRVKSAELLLKEQQTLNKELQNRLRAEMEKRGSEKSNLIAVQAQLKDAQKKLTTYEELLRKAEFRAENAEYTERVLQKKYGDAQLHIYELEKERDQAQFRSKGQEQRLTDVQERELSSSVQHQNLTQQLRECQTNLDAARQQAIDSKRALHRTEEKLVEVKRRLKSAETEAEEFKQQSRSERSQLGSHLAEFQTTSKKLAAAEVEVVRLTEKCQNFETQLIDLRKQNLDQQNELLDVQRMLKDTQGTLEEANNRLKLLEDGIKEARLEAETVKAQLPRYEHAYDELAEKTLVISELQEKVNVLEIEIDKLHKEKIDLSQKFAKTKPMPEAIKSFLSETEHGQILLLLAEGKRNFEDLFRKFNYPAVILMRELRHLRDKQLIILDEEKREVTLMP